MCSLWEGEACAQLSFLCSLFQCRVCEHVLNCGWGCVVGLVLTFFFFCVPLAFFFLNVHVGCVSMRSLAVGVVSWGVSHLFLFLCSLGLFLFNVHVGCVSMCSIVVGVVSWGLYSLFSFLGSLGLIFFGHVLTYCGGCADLLCTL